MTPYRRDPVLWFAVLATTLLLASCRSPETEGASAAFDAEAYFGREAQRMAERHATLDKTAWLNHRTESLAVDTPDWTAELRVFSACGLGGAAWRQTYTCDTVPAADNRYLIRYTAREPSARIARLIVTTHAGLPVAVEVEKRSDNLFYRSATWLRYVPDSGFVIRHNRKALFRDADSLAISGVVLFPDGPAMH